MAETLTEQLPLAEVESLRDIAMKDVRPYARNEVCIKKEDKKARKFVLYSDSGESIGSNEIDEFLGILVSKDHFRNWSLKISFLEYILSEAGRYSNFREIYDFQCIPNLGCLATKKSIFNDVAILSTRSDVKSRKIIDTVQPNRLVSLEVMTLQDCDEVCDKMLRVLAKIKNQKEIDV